MNKNIIFGSLIAGGLIGAAIIMGFVMSKPDASQQVAVQTEAAESTGDTPATQDAPTNNPAPTPAAQTAPQAPVSTPVATPQAPAPAPAAQTVAPPPAQVAQKQTTPINAEGVEFCPGGAGGGVQVDYFETKSFTIYMCEGGGLKYHGISKKDGKSITLPAYTEEGTGYVAENGNYTYIVNGASLTVMEGNKVLQEENIIN